MKRAHSTWDGQRRELSAAITRGSSAEIEEMLQQMVTIGVALAFSIDGGLPEGGSLDVDGMGYGPQVWKVRWCVCFQENSRTPWMSKRSHSTRGSAALATSVLKKCSALSSSPRSSRLRYPYIPYLNRMLDQLICHLATACLQEYFCLVACDSTLFSQPTY